LFGTRVLGRAMGIVLAADGVAEALAPVLVGRLHDVSGSYTSGFSALIAFAITGAIAISLLPRGRAGNTPQPIAVPGHA
jgi:cyanate permease